MVRRGPRAGRTTRITCVRVRTSAARPNVRPLPAPPRGRYSWNKASLERVRDERRLLSNPFATCIRGIASALPIAILGVAAVTQMQSTDINRCVFV